MATRLSLYNGALLECGERDLASLTENRESRRLLDRVWDNAGVDYCLKQAQWVFARRSQEITPDTSVATAFGYSNAFEIPADLVRTVAICSDEYGRAPVLAYQVEGRYWYSDVDPLYVSYVSNDAAYGGNLAAWPADFARAVEVYFASRIVKKLTQSEEKEGTLIKLANRLFKEAASASAMEMPTVFPPLGGWASSRGGSRGDRGSRSKLLG